MDLNDANLPSDVRNFLVKTLTDRGLSLDDPICSVVLTQVSMMELERKRRRKVAMTSALLGFIVASGGYFCGHWSATRDLLKARPMISISTPSASAIYGTQAGQRVIKINAGTETVQGLWHDGSMVYILVQ